MGRGQGLGGGVTGWGGWEFGGGHKDSREQCWGFNGAVGPPPWSIWGGVHTWGCLILCGGVHQMLGGLLGDGGVPHTWGGGSLTCGGVHQMLGVSIMVWRGPLYLWGSVRFWGGSVICGGVHEVLGGSVTPGGAITSGGGPSHSGGSFSPGGSVTCWGFHHSTGGPSVLGGVCRSWGGPSRRGGSVTRRGGR